MNISIAFKEDTIVDGVLVKAGEPYDASALDAERIAEFRERGMLAAYDSETEPKTGLSKKRSEELTKALAERTEEHQKAVAELEAAKADTQKLQEEVRGLRSSIEQMSTQIKLSEDAAKVQQLMDRNSVLADVLDAFKPEKDSDLNRFTEAELKLMAGAWGIEGLPDKKADAIKRIVSHFAPKKEG